MQSAFRRGRVGLSSAGVLGGLSFVGDLSVEGVSVEGVWLSSVDLVRARSSQRFWALCKSRPAIHISYLSKSLDSIMPASSARAILP